MGGEQPARRATTYCYDAADDNACSAWTSTGTNTSVALSGLSLNTTYYWHVRATGAGGTTYANGSSTAFWSFVTRPAVPTVTAVSPPSGPLAGGTAFTITGTNFVAGSTSVTIGGTPATSVNVTSPTSLSAMTPAAGTAGARDVAVTTPGGTATLANGFTYCATPTVTAISEAGGPTTGGTTLTLTGTSFVAGNTAVAFGGTASTNVSVTSATSLTAVTPAHAAGNVNVVVTTPGGSGTLTGGFSYLAEAPTITSASPTSGPLAGGTVLTIAGVDFAAGVAVATVTVGGVAATGVTVVSGSTITAVTPASATTGARDVVVTTAGGTGR